MAHLTLDGVTVPVTQLSESPEEIGTRQRAFDGSYLVSRRATKRVWSGETPLLPPTEAEMIRGIIQGDGQNWSLEQGTLYTTKGVPPQSGTGYVLLHYIGADGDAVVDEYAELPVYYGGYSLAHYYPSRLNGLASNTATAEGTTADYTTTGVAPTLAMDTSNYWQGTQSLKTTYPVGGGFSGVRTKDGDVSSAGEHHGSVYLKGDSGGEQVDVYLYDAGTATTGTKTNATLVANQWTRFDCSLTVPAGTPDVRLIIGIDSPNGEVIYADGWQIIRSELPVPWIDGTAAALSLWYDFSVVKPNRDMTVCGWFHMPDQGLLSDNRTMLNMYDSVDVTNLFLISRRSDLNVGLRWVTRDYALVGTDTLSYGTDAIWATGWHYIACVMSHNPDTGRYNKEMYFDGALVQYNNTTAIPDFDTTDTGVVTLLCSNKTGSNPLFGTTDQLRILPYALTPSAVASLYASGFGAGETPIVRVDGDGIAKKSAQVIGKASTISQAQTGADFRSSVSFNLNEV